MFRTTRIVVGVLLFSGWMNAGVGQDDSPPNEAGSVESFQILSAGECVIRWCPSGSLTMHPQGNKPVEVTLTEGFWIAETETTQRQFSAVTDTAPWIMNGVTEGDGIGDDYPATYVTHAKAVAYCERLTQIEQNAGRLPEGWKYSLPTAAQWEYACRAGTTTVYSFGDDWQKLGDHAWYEKNTDDEQYAHQVRSKEANPWGLYDMHGNVSEWCLDGYKGYSWQIPGGDDPFVSADNDAAERVIRGGSWGYSLIDCRSASHVGKAPETRSSTIGFRVVKVPVR